MDLRKIAIEIVEKWKLEQEDQKIYIQGKYDGLMEFLNKVGEENAKLKGQQDDSIVSDEKEGSGDEEN